MANNESIFLLTSVNGEQQLLVDRELLAGREASCDLLLDQGQASRHHAKLKPATDGVWVEDLQSTNGTFVNEARISAATLIKVGDELRIGPARFKVIPAPVTTIDKDATLLYNPDSTLKDANEANNSKSAISGESLSFTQPDSVVPRRVETDSNVSKENDSKAPPSWVLSNQQSVDGTKFISKDMLQEVVAQSAGPRIKASVQEPSLIGNSDPIMGMRFQLIGAEKNQWEIGRSPNSDVMINHDSVSSSHAQVIREGARWKLVDLMSANGSYVNGKKCLSGYLASGDSLRFGNVECAFVTPGGENIAAQSSGSIAENSSGNAIKTAAIAFSITAALAAAAVFAISRFL